MSGSRDSEFAVVEGLWQELSDERLIRDVAMKGRFLSNSITFLSIRNNYSLSSAKDLFFSEATSFVNDLLNKKQIYRAQRVLSNIQLNEFYYLFDFYLVCKLFTFENVCF